MYCIAIMVTAPLPMSPQKWASATVATAWVVFSGIMTTTEIWTSMSRTMSRMCCIATTAMTRLPMLLRKRGVGDGRWGTGAAFGDYDNDGDLDLYVPNYIDHDLDKLAQDQKTSMQYGQSVPRILNPHSFEPQDNVMYRNNGDGTFTDVTTELGVESHGGRSLQAIFTDFDLDGDLELYVANDLSPNFLYRNNGDGTFTDISDASWAADFRGSMGLATGDYDGDGDLDLFMSHWIEQENALYSNMWKEEGAMGGESSKVGAMQPIHLVDDSYGASLGEESLKYVGWGTDLFDYDNDGDLDIFVANGHTFQYLDNYDLLIPQKDQFFRYEGDGIFADVSAATGIAAMPYRVGRGTAFGDYDSDGDVDIFIVNNHGPRGFTPKRRGQSQQLAAYQTHWHERQP